MQIHIQWHNRFDNNETIGSSAHASAQYLQQGDISGFLCYIALELACKEAHGPGMNMENTLDNEKLSELKPRTNYFVIFDIIFLNVQTHNPSDIFRIQIISFTLLD